MQRRKVTYKLYPSARVVLRWALGTSAASDHGITGQELAAALKPETPSKPHSVFEG